MPSSPYQKVKRIKKYERVRLLYKQGLTLRDIAEIVGMSRQWVWFVVRGKGLKEVEEMEFSDLMKEKEK